MAERARHHATKVGEIEAKVQQAETREAEASAQVQQAIAVAQQAQESAQRAEARAQQAETREAEASAQVQQAIAVAQQAQESAQRAEARAQQAETREAEASAQVQQAIAVAQQALESARRAEVATASVAQELQGVHQTNHFHSQLAEERGQYIQTLLNSTSWRVTAPMRWMVTTTRSIGLVPKRATLRLKIWLKPHLVRAVTSPMSKQMIERTGRWVIAHPRLSDPIRASLQRHERLRNRLRWLVLGLPPPGPAPEVEQEPAPEPLPLPDVTAGARRVYHELRATIASTESPS
jgi:O-antigen chain-terminating methyltransferase